MIETTLLGIYAIAVLASVPPITLLPLNSFVQNTFGILIVIVFGIRVWLLFFDYNYCEVLASKQWEAILSPKSFEENWFLRQKLTLGEGGFLLKWCISLVVLFRIVAYIPVVTVQNVDLDITRSVDTSVMIGVLVIVSLFAGGIWLKFRRFPDDGYFIRSEFQALAISLTVVVLIAIPMMIATRWLNLSRPLWHIIIQFIFCGWICIMIFYPKWKVKREENATCMECMTIRKSPTIMDMHVDVEGHWKQSIGTKRGYESFGS